MSADNGIYIHKFRDGYRVAHCQAIDNIYWHKGKNKYNYRILKQYFKNSLLFNTIEEAIKQGIKIEKDFRKDGLWTEYGINEI